MTTYYRPEDNTYYNGDRQGVDDIEMPTERPSNFHFAVNGQWELNLSAARTYYKDSVDTIWGQKNQAGFTFQTYLIATDTLAAQNINSIATYVALFNALPNNWPGFWKAANGDQITIIEADDFKDLYQALIDQGITNFARAQTLKYQIDQATDLESMITIAASWDE